MDKVTWNQRLEYLKTPEAIGAFGAAVVARQRKALERKLDTWAGKYRTGGLCCSSTWVDDLCNSPDSTYWPSTPCDSKRCRKIAARYPSYYVKVRAWRLRRGVPVTIVGTLCEDCWQAWIRRHIQDDYLAGLKLTEREREMLALAEDGKRQADIAAQMDCSQYTVSVGLSEVRKKILGSNQ